MKKIRSVFIGGGPDSAVGRAHVSAIRLDNKYDLQGGIFSSDTSRNEAAHREYNLKSENVISTVEDIISMRNKIDLVHILTPPDQHHHVIKRLLSNSIAVISEKPLVTSVEEARDLVSTVEEFNAFLPVMYNYLGYPMIRELRSKLSQSWLGNLHEIKVSMPQEGFMKIDRGGKAPLPQKWRQVDYSLPTVSLDLGVHCHMLVSFLTGLKAEGVYAKTTSAGRVSNVVDSVNALVDYENKILVDFWFGKSYLGFRNGFSIEIFGDRGSVRWAQIDPENLYYCDVYGEKRVIDRGSPDIEVANDAVYERFKVGHPSGFIEAMSNYYGDVYESLSNKKFTANVFGVNESLEGLKLLEAINHSSNQKKWVACT